jgi:hypothetical protein
MDGREGVAMGVTPLIEGCGEVLPPVKAIGALERVGGPLPGPIRIGSASLPGHHPDAGMGLPPERHGLGLTIGPERERSPPFAIAQPGPIGLACAIGPIVDAEHLGVAKAGQGRRRSRRRRVWRLTAKPRARLRRTPALPPALSRSAPACA